MAQAQASNISGIYNDKVNEILARLAQAGQFGTQAGISATGGLQSSGQGLAELAAARGNAVASGLGGISGAFGTYFGLKH